MPKFTPEKLRSTLNPGQVEITPQIKAALGSLGLGDVAPRGIDSSTDQRASTPGDHHPVDPLDAIKMPEIKAAFQESLAASRLFYEKFDITAPSAMDLVMHGIDFDQLADVFFRARTRDLEPELLLAAYGFDPTAWLAAYNGILRIAPVIKRNWGQLTIPPPGSFGQHRAQWTLRIVTGTLEPPISARNATHSTDNNDHNPTIPEYLALQAIRAEAGKKPLDTRYSSWLAGKFDGTVTVNAPCGHYNQDKQELDIACDNIGNPIYNVGSRQVVR